MIRATLRFLWWLPTELCGLGLVLRHHEAAMRAEEGRAWSYPLGQRVRHAVTFWWRTWPDRHR